MGPRLAHQLLADIGMEFTRPALTSLDATATTFAMRIQNEARTGLIFQVKPNGELQRGNGTNFTAAAVWRPPTTGSGWETPNDVHLVSPASLFIQGISTPPAPVSGHGAIYIKSGKLVVAYNDGTTTRYKYLALNDTSTTWVYSATPPT